MSDPFENISDEVLLARYQRGERTAFAVLVRRHQVPLYNFALRQVRIQSVAEDIVQEGFVRVVQNAHEFKQAARFTTWVYTIIRNLCIDHLRKSIHRRHASLDEAGGVDGEGPTLGERTADTRANVERQAVSDELNDRISKALLLLPQEQREVFLLREGANLPFKEIAEVIGIPENTVKSRMRYALERLQHALSDYEEVARALE